MKKILSIFAAVSIFASACVIPVAYAEDAYTFTHDDDNFIAGTDFEDRYNQGADKMLNNAWCYLDISSDNVELVGTQAHSGSYALHTKNLVTGEIRLRDVDWSFAFWNNKYNDNRTAAIQKGKTYRFSYWVYADKDAEYFTPRVLTPIQNSWNWIINNDDWKTDTVTSIKKEQWNYFEVTYTSEVDGKLPIFFDIPADLYIDDIKLEEVTAPKMTETSLPSDGSTAQLGYNKYTMTFDKAIKSADIKLGDRTVTDYTINGKTVEFGLRFITAGSQTLTVTVTDNEGQNSTNKFNGTKTTITRTFTVPDTLVAYAGFDESGKTAVWYYLTNVGDGALLNTVGDYYSPGYGAKIIDTGEYWNDVRLETAEWSGVRFNRKTVEPGKWYRMSFYAKRADSLKTPMLGVAQDNTGMGQVTIDADTMTKYYVDFKAVNTKLPRFYREQKDGDIIIDEILIERIEAPVDYTFNIDAKRITAGGAITAVLTNEREAAMNATAILALYKDNELIDVKTVKAENLAKGQTVQTEAITVSSKIDDGVYAAKAFLWSDLTGSMEPIQPPIVIEEPKE